MIDAFASAPHYADHVAAVFGALPEGERGTFYAPPLVADRVRRLGFAPEPLRDGPDRPILVSCYGDMGRAVIHGRTRVALMEHGAGQSYGGRNFRHGSYAGGDNRDAASLFLHPGPHPAERDRARYPGARVEVVGSPHLDTLPTREGEPGRTVAFSVHFNTNIVPETRNAFPWIWEAVKGLRDQGYDVIGHAHPRTFDRYVREFNRAGIEAVREFSDVCKRADVYVCDNSSTLFAFAATGRPVVVLNPPWYDRRVNHGLRFWEAASVGVNCDAPDDLARCVEEALRDTPEQQAAREAALDLVYAYRSGAGQRAAGVLQEWAA